MMLTDKCKDDFKKWLKVKDSFLFEKDGDLLYLTDLHEHLLNGYIIDFFDSVGIYVNIEVEDPVMSIFNYSVLCNNNFRTESGRVLRQIPC